MSEIREMGLAYRTRAVRDFGEWAPSVFCCDLCGQELKGDSRVLMSALLSSLVMPEQDELFDRRVYDWPAIPLRRKRICPDCYDPARHVRFFGLENGGFVIGIVLPEGARQGYCRVCMDRRTLWDGIHCRESEVPAAPDSERTEEVS